MGFRLHNCSMYRVKYEGGYFNHYIEKINNLFNELFDNIYFDNEEIEYSYSFEIPKEDFLKGIQHVKEHKEYYTDLLKSREIDYSVDEFIAILENMYATSDKNIDYIKFEWF